MNAQEDAGAASPLDYVACMSRASDRSFRFGVVATDKYNSAQWQSFARRVEGAGFDTLLVADHYTNALACTPLIAWAAASTTTLRVGSYVYCNDFRHPALLAKEIATMDVLSEGRVEFGIGAGWLKQEYEQVGLSFDPPGVRADRFEEAVELTAAVLRGGSVTFSGHNYQLTGYEATPSPVQPRIPLLIGGGGPRMIRLAARHSDIFGLVPRSLPEGGLDPREFAASEVARKLSVLDEALDREGRSDGGPERSALIFGIYERAEQCPADGWIPPDLVADSPHSLVGDPRQVADTLERRRHDLGITYYVCFDYEIDQMEPIVAACRG